MERRPEFLIVAGPNGAGKSTVASVAADAKDVLDPDAICRRVRSRLSALKAVLGAQAFADATNYVAVVQVEAAVAAAILRRRSIAIETVLSTDKYLKHVRWARQRGFEVRMVFVALPDAEDHVRRVAMRRQAGGHPVPEDKIRSRWWRSHAMLEKFVPHLDYLLVLSNAAFTQDGQPHPVVVAEKDSLRGPMVMHDRDALPEITRRLG